MKIDHIHAFTDNYIWVIRNDTRVTLVDPGDPAPVLQYLHENDLILQDILITHHHWDHIGGISQLTNATNMVPMMMSNKNVLED